MCSFFWHFFGGWSLFTKKKKIRTFCLGPMDKNVGFEEVLLLFPL